MNEVPPNQDDIYGKKDTPMSPERLLAHSY